MIRFYLGEEPILHNVRTYLLSDERSRKEVLGRLHELVVKPTSESGGKGVFIGPQASAAQREQQARLIEAQPDQFIAQELVQLSTAPTETGDGRLAPRHVDLRPFAVFGEEIRIVPGGLTRVALREGSMIVNSSQGGGSKDTWVLEDDSQADLAPGTLPPAPAPAARCRATATGTGQAQQQQQQPPRLRPTSGTGQLDARPDRPGAVLARPRPDPRRADRPDPRRHISRRCRGRARRARDRAQLGGRPGDDRRRAAGARRGAASAAISEQPLPAFGRDRGRAAADARHRQPGVGRLLRRPGARAGRGRCAT